MSLKLIANWKLNGSKNLNETWLQSFLKLYKDASFSSIGIAPPAIFIGDLVKMTASTGIAIGSQNIDSFLSGARTGEISASMVKDLQGTFSIVGHSERRIFFNESNDDISLKVDLVSTSSLIPVLCIGESEEQNIKNETHAVLEKQITAGLTDCKDLQRLILAYEPVWAIGSGNTPDPKEVNSIHEFIKDVVQSRFSKLDLEAVLYGGSVNSDNATSFFKEKEIDGALVGGASLDGEKFALIANIFNDLKG